MPELPEVEVVRRGLVRALPGRIVTACRSDGKPLRQPVPADDMQRYLIGARIVDIRRRAKYLLIDFDNGALLVLHLGMSGKLGIFPATSPQQRHDHLCWRFDDGQELRFNDTRRFGCAQLLCPEGRDKGEQQMFSASGPEPFGPDFSARYLKDAAVERRLPVKQFLMDGRTVAGIGNIYANEILFAARIAPHRPVNTISSKRWRRLIARTREILQEAIDCGGSTISDFIGSDGKGGYFQVRFAVYGRRGKACRHCATPIEEIRLGGRSTFFCPKCQH